MVHLFSLDIYLLFISLKVIGTRLDKYILLIIIRTVLCLCYDYLYLVFALITNIHIIAQLLHKLLHNYCTITCTTHTTAQHSTYNSTLCSISDSMASNYIFCSQTLQLYEGMLAGGGADHIRMTSI